MSTENNNRRDRSVVQTPVSEVVGEMMLNFSSGREPEAKIVPFEDVGLRIDSDSVTPADHPDESGYMHRWCLLL